jgi:type I restriction enzyme S subunit
MSEWKEDVLENVAQLEKESWKVGDENLPYIALEHIVEGGLRLQGIGDSNTIASNKYRFNSDCFLFGKLRPYFRKLYRPNFEGICSTDIWVVKPKGENDKDFLFYFFANQEFVDFTYSGSSGTRMPRADWKFVGKSKWYFPEPTEQKAIAEILTSLDDKIDLLHRQNNTLEAMAETLFREWFVEEAEEDWEERPLSSIANFLNGLACQKYPPKNQKDKLPVLKIKQLRNGISKDCDWCTTDVKSEYIVNNGDVIFSWSASLMVKIWDGKTAILNQHLFKVTSDEFPKWYYYLWSKYHLNKFISIAKAHATTMGHIKRGDLDKAMVLIPDNDKMDEFTEIQEPIIEKIITNNKQLSKLVELRDTLLPKLMSGEIKVVEDE